MKASAHKTTVAITTPEKDGTVSVMVNEQFPSFYNNYKGHETPGRDYSRLSPEDERAGIFVHEGKHVDQYRNGMTLESYNTNSRPYEEDAYETQRAINHAYDSVSIYDSPN